VRALPLVQDVTIVAAMKTLQSAVRDAPARAVESDIRAVVETLFLRWPALVGFSVQDGGDGSDQLYLMDIQAYPWPSEEDSAGLRRDIIHAFLELMDEAPDARELLRARTFARTLH
jgi:hypothetical protein